MSETESHCENLEKGVIDETTEQQPEIEKDASAGSKIIHIGMKYLLVGNLIR